MNKPPNKKGIRFRELLERSPFQANEFALKLGVNNPQNVTHWYKRGVPSPYAQLAAHLLDCQPDEISKILVKPVTDPKEAEIRKLKREIREKMDQILDHTDQLNTLKMIDSQIEAYRRLGDS